MSEKSQLEKTVVLIGISIGAGLMIAAILGIVFENMRGLEVIITAQTVWFFLLGKKVGHKYYDIKRFLFGSN